MNTPISTPAFNRAIIGFAPRPFALYMACLLFVQIGRLVPGIIEMTIFNRLAGHHPDERWLLTLIAIFVGVETARFTAALGDYSFDIIFEMTSGAVVRHNVLSHLLARPGAEGRKLASGEIVNRLRDDVDEVTDFPTWFPQTSGSLVCCVVALVVMAHISLTITLVTLVPFILAAVVSRFAWGTLHAAWSASGSATDAVTGYIGQIFSAVTAITLAGAEEPIVGHLHELGVRRARLGIITRVLNTLVRTLADSATALATGIMLILAGHAMAADSFSVGDFALFMAYLPFAAETPSEFAGFMADYANQSVSLRRLEEVVDGDGRRLVAPHDLPSEAAVAQPVSRVQRHAGPLITLEVSDLTCVFPTTGGGVRSLSFALRRGELVVITGPTGAGKTTLLRALLGLLPVQSGRTAWNGTEISDPAAHFRPPATAYVPQVPMLFSDSLSDNISLGTFAEHDRLSRAVWTAALDADVAELPLGLDTPIGAHGVRLSGGQLQRAAAARALLHQPDLLVVDDLSSALDVRTERLIWDRVVNGGSDTVLAVSHRRPLLSRADRVIVLAGGAVQDMGSAPELLARCETFQHIWRSDHD
jgi:ATP-binding cassette subfamily B protein